MDLRLGAHIERVAHEDVALGLAVRTPLLESTPLSAALGRPVWLKLEALQPTGSFKIRGIGRLCRALVRQGAKRLISSSGGNAGLAVAYAGRRLDIAVTVVVPRTTPRWIYRKIEDEGAGVVVRGEVWDEADEHARTLARHPECGYVPPFDHPEIWSGHATVIDESAEEIEPPGCVIVAVGGGGLLCGVAEGLARVGWHDVPIIAVETHGAASFAAALDAGRVVRLEAITSVAKSLGARQVSQRAVEWAGQRAISSVVVSDEAAVNACLRFADDHRILVEPACGAALSLIYDAVAPVSEMDSALVVVCGGAGVSLAELARWKAREPGDGGKADQE